MSEEMTSGAASREVPLPTAMRGGWIPYEIVYTLYTYPPGNPGGQNVRPKVSSHVFSHADIRSFIGDRIAGRPLPAPAMVREHNDEDNGPRKDINIYVGRPCYVVVELEGQRQWQFTDGRPAITAHADYQDDNGALEHVMPNGDLTGPSGPRGDGCKLAYFGVNARCRFEHQSFTIHLDFGTSGLREPDQIDPDIPNDGGKFPFSKEKKCPEDPPELDEAAE